MHKKIGPYKGTQCGVSAIRSRIPADGSPSFVEPVIEDEKRGGAVYQEMAEVVFAECERHDSPLPGVAQHFAGVALSAEYRLFAGEKLRKECNLLEMSVG